MRYGEGECGAFFGYKSHAMAPPYRSKVWAADRTLSMESGVSHAKDHLCKDAYDSITGNATGEYRG